MRADETRTGQLEGQLASEAETAALAAALAGVLRPGDTVLLRGPVGAGKSALARALIRAAQAAAGGPVEEVPSPSYTLMQDYAAGPRRFVHADLYRLGSSDEVAELGLDEAMEEAICLIEWPERLGAETPARHVALTLLPVPEAEGARAFRLETHGPGWEALRAAVREATG